MSTFSTLLTVRDQLRVELRETVANAWEDDELNTYINIAHRRLCSELGNVPGSGWMTETEQVTLGSGLETLNLGLLTRDFAALKRIWYERGGEFRPLEMEPILPGNTERYRFVGNDASSAIPPKYFLARSGQTELLHVLPVGGFDRDFKILYRYQPPTLAGDAERLHTPDRYDDLLVRAAKQSSLQAINQVDPVVDAYVERRMAEMREMESNTEGEHVPMRLDTTEGDALFSGDAHWSF